ncbi:linear amide C-N hydrolase [Corticicoccus populi]|uniref:Linear amide C-N hydrolase n=1 Tax=Corticicoccus populi TaxID=1812821 RepID=A0ABW5WXC8_9STAP
MKTYRGIIALCIVIFSVITAGAVILFTRIKTMRSIKNIEGDLYQVDYHANYKLDDILKTGVKNVDELEGILSKKLFFGYPVKTNENLFGCSAFSAETPEGKHIVGRNFDYAQAAALLVYTSPKEGYRSYSMVNLAHLGVSEETGTMPETLIGKFSILAAPYGPVDGLNEKGLSVSVLELQTEPTAQNTGKTNIITTLAVRMLLDKAANVNEAVAMLGTYDMHSSAGMPYHLLIADKTGHTVVVDWSEQEMNIVDARCATNFQLSPGKDFGTGIGHDRYNELKETLKSSASTLTAAEAMHLLEKVSIEWNGEWDTEWSVVYHLDDFSLDICNDMNYQSIHHFSK